MRKLFDVFRVGEMKAVHSIQDVNGLLIDGAAGAQESSINSFDMCRFFCHYWQGTVHEFLRVFHAFLKFQDFFVDHGSELRRELS